MQQTSSTSEIGFTHHHSKYFAHFLTCEGIDEADALAQSLSSVRVDPKAFYEFPLVNCVLLRLVAAANPFLTDVGKQLLWDYKERVPPHKVKPLSIKVAK